MPFQPKPWTMQIDETRLHQSLTSCFRNQSNMETEEQFDFHSSRSGWQEFSSIPSSPESPNLNRNFYNRKGQIIPKGSYRTNYAQKPMKDPGYYSSGSSSGSISPPNSPLEQSFLRMRLENTPRREEICIGLKPSERINFYRETLPRYNQPELIPNSSWERMAPLKAPLRRPNSPPSYLI